MRESTGRPADPTGPRAALPADAHAVQAASAQAVRAIVDRAAAVLAVHADRDGMCDGCIEMWARLAPFPCEQRQWAESVAERFGPAPQSPVLASLSDPPAAPTEQPTAQPTRTHDDRQGPG